MTSLPQTLYRRVTGEEAMNNHFRGVLWFRSPSYFRRVEGPQNDPMEGIGSYDFQGRHTHSITDDKPLASVHLLSFAESIQATDDFRSTDAPSYLLELQEPTKLETLIRKALSPEWTVEWEKVKYDKVMDVKYELLPSESYRRQYFRKPEKYANEREWRLVITFKRTDRIILNETLKFHFSELGDHDLWECVA